MASRFTGCCNSVLSTIPNNCWAKCAGCKVCPPKCCTCVEWHFEVKDASTSLYDPGIRPIEKRKLSALGPISDLQLPEFSTPEAHWNSDDGFDFFSNDYLFALGGSCSFPCTTANIKVTVCHHCCIYNKTLAVGAGTVTASCPPTACGGKITLIPSVNGNPYSAYVADGGSISVSLSATGVTDCPFSVTFKKIVDPCAPYGTPLYIYKKDTSGKTKMFINTYEAVEQHMHKQKINSLRRKALIRKQNKKNI